MWESGRLSGTQSSTAKQTSSVRIAVFMESDFPVQKLVNGGKLVPEVSVVCDFGSSAKIFSLGAPIEVQTTSKDN